MATEYIFRQRFWKTVTKEMFYTGGTRMLALLKRLGVSLGVLARLAIGGVQACMLPDAFRAALSELPAYMR